MIAIIITLAIYGSIHIVIKVFHHQFQTNTFRTHCAFSLTRFPLWRRGGSTQADAHFAGGEFPPRARGGPGIHRPGILTCVGSHCVNLGSVLIALLPHDLPNLEITSGKTTPG